MIQILFIIDFLENIVCIGSDDQNRPKSKEMKRVLKAYIKKVISGCTDQSVRYKQLIEDKLLNILATAVDENHIVGTIV